MISKLKKLKGRSFAELADRGRQKATILAERSGMSRDLMAPSDSEFLARFSRDAAAGSTSRLLERFRTQEPSFFPVFRERSSALLTLRSFFPDEEKTLVVKADRLASGIFDLLGYSGLEFGAPVPDWHFEPISGKRSPLIHWSLIDETDASETGDKKIVWELNRHQYFTVLGRVYWLTGGEKYAEVFIDHIVDWIEKNPPKVGVNWMSSLEIAYRSISWIWALHFFRDSPSLSSEVFLKILKVLYLNARHLTTHLSVYSSPNTHLTGEALGLCFIAAFLRDIDEALEWRETAYQILLKALDYQIRIDGGYVEQAVHYHRYTADIFLSLYIHRKSEGLPIADIHDRKLRKMLEFLAHLTQPNGETPAIGDDDGGRLHFFDNRGYADFRSTLAVGAAVLNDGRLKFVAESATPEILWLAGLEGVEAFELLKPLPPDEKAKAFAGTGWYVVRDGWGPESSYLLIDCGEHGFMNGGHAHADALSFVLSVKGEPVFVDSGTFAYTADQLSRDLFRSSPVHNCLTVNGQSSSVPDGPFSWKTKAVTKILEWKPDGNNSVLRGTHNGYERMGVRYEREFEFTSNTGMTLTDRIETMTGNDFDICFVLSPGVEAEIIGATRVILRAKAGNRDLLTIDTKVVEEKPDDFRGWRIEPARISPRYGSVVKNTTLVFSLIRDHDFQVENRMLFARPA